MNGQLIGKPNVFVHAVSPPPKNCAGLPGDGDGSTNLAVAGAVGFVGLLDPQIEGEIERIAADPHRGLLSSGGQQIRGRELQRVARPADKYPV